MFDFIAYIEQYLSTSWKAHQGSISAIGVADEAGRLAGHVLTGGSDGQIKLWKLGDGQPELVQTIDLKGKLPLDLELANLPGDEGALDPSTWLLHHAHLPAPIMVAGLTDKRIRIYTFINGQFTHALGLEGHEDWVRCLAITPYPSSTSDSDSKDLLLASGSQDNYIRLWRISPIAERASTTETSAITDGGLDMLDEFERKLAGEAGGSVQISTKAHVLSIDGDNG